MMGCLLACERVDRIFVRSLRSFMYILAILARLMVRVIRYIYSGLGLSAFYIYTRSEAN